MNEKTLKTMRINLVIFAVLQIFFVVSVAQAMHTQPTRTAGVFIQYIISSWIIRKFVIKTKKDEEKIVLYTWLVSFAVFIARILLGVIFFSLVGAK